MSSTDATTKSERVLAELKLRQRGREIVDVEQELVKVVVFTCGGGRYALYGSEVREFLPGCGISWVPGLPEYLPGLINVRGDIESVLDIRPFLAEESRGGNGLIAMVVRGEFRTGVLIDRIEDVVDVPVGDVKPPLSTLNGAARDLVLGELDYGGALVPLLDVGKLAAKISL